MPIRPLIITLLLFAASFTLFGKEIDLDHLATEAAKTDRHLLVWLHKTDCGYCEAMREFTLEDDTIATELKKHFLFVPINVYDDDWVILKDFSGSGKAFAKKTGYNFYPSTLFIDQNGKIIFAAPGYINLNDFRYMLKFINSGAYRTQSYNAFRQQEETP